MSMTVINEENDQGTLIFGSTFPHVLSQIDGIFAAMILVCKLKQLCPRFKIYEDDTAINLDTRNNTYFKKRLISIIEYHIFISNELYRFQNIR